jgi:hypothetical protein
MLTEDQVVVLVVVQEVGPISNPGGLELVTHQAQHLVKETMVVLEVILRIMVVVEVVLVLLE